MGYLILAGVKDDEGVVISRNEFGPAHEDHLDSKNGTWFLVQANNDEWDSGCTGRCASARDRIAAIGQANITLDDLRNDVMLLAPNNNAETLYNTDFIPKTSYINTLPIDTPARNAGDTTYETDRAFTPLDHLA